MTATIPNPGLGTFRLEGDVLKRALNDALDLGFRHIDTAQAYNNEAEIGAILNVSGIARDELFLATKVWYENLASERFLPSVRQSLDRLGSDYVDMLLIHWPSPKDAVPMAEYMQALADAKAQGLTRHIGISNFTIEQTRCALELVGEGQILTNQVETHPFLQNNAVVDFCQANGITVTGYMPLAVGKVMQDETLARLANKHGASIPQVVLAWLQQRDIVVIPSSTKREHLAANLEAFSLRLDADDMTAIGTLERGERLANPDFAPAWD